MTDDRRAEEQPSPRCPTCQSGDPAIRLPWIANVKSPDGWLRDCHDFWHSTPAAEEMSWEWWFNRTPDERLRMIQRLRGETQVGAQPPAFSSASGCPPIAGEMVDSKPVFYDLPADYSNEPCQFCGNWHDPCYDECLHPRCDKVSKEINQAWKIGYEIGKARTSSPVPSPPQLGTCDFGPYSQKEPHEKCENCVNWRAGANTGEGAEEVMPNEPDANVGPQQSDAVGGHGATEKTSDVVPSGGAQPMSAEQFHKTECGIAIPLYATLDENGQGRAPTTGEILAAIYKFAEAYAASSNAQLQRDLDHFAKQNLEWAKCAEVAQSKVSALEGELREARVSRDELRIENERWMETVKVNVEKCAEAEAKVERLQAQREAG